MYNALGEYHCLKRWTPAAIDCYERGCVCKGCTMNKRFEAHKCNMKASVLELVRKFGRPKDIESEE